MNKKLRFKIFLTYSTLMLTFCIQAMSNSTTSKSNYSYEQEFNHKLDLYMKALTKLNRFSGSVLVAKGDEVLLNKGYGLASYEFEVPNTPQTKFRICSITKMVTAVAVMQLQKRGLLEVNDHLNKYFDDFPRGDEITIHQLLTHTSGLSSGNVPFEMVVCPATLEEICSFFKNESLEYEPGSDYQYSNAGYFILSYIIEKVSGKSYESFVKENILVPLNMNESYFREYDYAILKNSATGYCFNEKNVIVNGHHVYDNFKGGGGLFCTAHDLYLFARALIKNELINQESLKQMCTPYRDEENYGYGCHIRTLLNHKLIEHGGMLSSGFKSNLSILDDEIYIIILSNFFCSWVNEARDALAAITLGLPHEFPSNEGIQVDSAIYNDYIGIYDHTLFSSGYKIERVGDKLYAPDGIELSPVSKDQFMVLNCDSDNVVYKFIRDEYGYIVQLIIKGGAPYFEVRCKKIK